MKMQTSNVEPFQGGGKNMKTPMEYVRRHQEKGAIGYILAWALGIPVSVLLVIFLLRGCT